MHVPFVADTRVMRVLVVDDDPGVRTSVAAALRRDGCSVELACDGTEALGRLASGKFDSVVLDVLMPGLDGLAACRRVAGRGDLTPILMLTARNLVADRVDGLDAGPTTIWSSRSQLTNYGPGCGPWRGATPPPGSRRAAR